jgi:hypothetical protein
VLSAQQGLLAKGAINYMSRFNLNAAKVGGGAPNTKLSPGKYVVRLEKNFIKESEDRKRAMTTYFISEFTVTKVLGGGEAFADKHGNAFAAVKEGDYRSWSNNMAHANAAGSLNEFLCAVDGTDPKNPEAIKAAKLDFDALLDDAVDSKNPMRGVTVEVVVGLKTTEQGNHFLQHSFAVAA